MAWAPYSFGDLIDNWGRDLEVWKLSNTGSFSAAGVYQQPKEEWVPDFGVLAPMSREIFMQSETAAYTSDDMYYVTFTNLQIGTWVRDGSREFKLHERVDYSPYDRDDLFVYRAKAERRLDNSDVKYSTAGQEL